MQHERSLPVINAINLLFSSSFTAEEGKKETVCLAKSAFTVDVLRINRTGNTSEQIHDAGGQAVKDRLAAEIRAPYYQFFIITHCAVS